MEHFNEEQRMLKRWWFLLLPALVVGILPLFIGDKAEGHPEAIVIPLVVAGLVLALFGFSSLKTSINEQRIYVKFIPFMVKAKEINWDDVVYAEVKKYDPLFQYGGWGYRKGWKRKKMALNVYGNTGLELHLKDDTKLMIGTQKKESLISYLTYIKQKYHLQQIVN